MPENQYCPQTKLMTFWQHVERFCADKQTYPVLVELSPSMNCNGRCEWCFYRGSHTGTDAYIDFEAVQKLLSDMAECGIRAINLTGEGEPTTHPRINEIISSAHDRGLKIGLFTNGITPVERPELLSWVRISVTQSMRLDTNVISFYAKHTDTGICFNYRDEYNIYAERICAVARNSGASHIQIRPALAGPYQLQDRYEIPLWLKNHESKTFKVIFPEYKWTDYVIPRGYEKCYGHYFCPSVTHEGNINTCMYHLGDEDFIFGNIYQSGFREIWEGNRRKEVIDRMRLIGCQRCCKNHEINKMLYAVKHPESVKHREFL